MTNYFTKTLIITLITLIAAAGINYSYDPANIFSDQNKYEQGIANLLVKGNNVTSIGNYDERITQKLIIKEFETAPDVIVLGSSRSMQIRSSNYSKGTFFNHSVSGGSLEDHVAIFEMYYAKNSLPKHVIIGADPWILNKYKNQTRWLSIKEYFNSFKKRLDMQQVVDNNNSISEGSNKYLQLISYAYLEESLKSIWTTLKRGDQGYYATSEWYLNSNVKLRDGSLVYGNYARNRGHDEIMMRAIANAKRGAIYSLGNFTELDSVMMRLFNSFIQYMIEKDIQVTIFLPPYHPNSYEIMSNNPIYSSVKESEKFFRQLAIDKKINLIGSYDGAHLGCTSYEFTDDMHPTPACIVRLMKEK